MVCISFPFDQAKPSMAIIPCSLAAWPSAPSGRKHNEQAVVNRLLKDDHNSGRHKGTDLNCFTVTGIATARRNDVGGIKNDKFHDRFNILLFHDYFPFHSYCFAGVSSEGLVADSDVLSLSC